MDVNQTHCIDHDPIYIESVCCIPQTKIMLSVNHISIKYQSRPLYQKAKEKSYDHINRCRKRKKMVDKILHPRVTKNSENEEPNLKMG